MKKILSVISSLVLSVTSLAVLAPSIAHAAAPYTCTWTGATNSNFNTAGNWSGCNSAAPQPGDGDNLVFDNTSLGADASLNNDITSLTVGSITFQGSGSHTFTLSGNGLTIASGITDNGSFFPTIKLALTLSASQTFGGSYGYTFGDSGTPSTINLNGHNLTIGAVTAYMYDALTGTGNLTVQNGGGVYLYEASSGWTGGTTITSGAQVYAYSGSSFGTSSSTVTASNGGLFFCGLNGATVAQALSIGGGTSSLGAIGAYIDCNQSSNAAASVANVTLSGAVTLTSNTTVDAAGTLTITGPLSGSFTIVPITGMTGTLAISSSNNTSLTPNGSAGAAATAVSYDDNSPSTDITVPNEVTATVDGTYGDTLVSSGGILKGTGTVGSLNVSKGGIVAPGHSPGCLTVSGDLTESGTYQAELGGTTACSGYDQLVVGGMVTLDDSGVPPTQGILQVSLVNGFKAKAGETFEIINNKGTKAVTDTFSGMAEGSTFTVSGTVFKITYKGGDGNDVVLSVVSAPNTGFALLQSQPLMVLVGTTLIGGTFLYTVKRGKWAHGRR